ncbi:MAG TPA: tetratricopeptide repeat protein [Flavobacteriaceae bacterium]|nr:tetratricopeptide repeat protein [Flavobacteriaceae bacterium]
MRILLLLWLLPVCVWAQDWSVEVEKLLDSKQYAKAQQHLQTQLDKQPQNWKALELMGDVYCHQELWDQAIEAYKQVVAATPEQAHLQYKYGGAMGMKSLQVSKFKALGMIDDIEEAFLKAASLDPQHLETRWALVQLYMKLPGIVGGSKKKALLYANELQALSLVDGYLAKGFIYQYDKDYPEAETHFRKAIKVGGSVTCYTQLADCYLAQDKTQQALITLQEAATKHPSSTVISQKMETIKNKG